jgi:hypothetical protein
LGQPKMLVQSWIDPKTKQKKGFKPKQDKSYKKTQKHKHF